MARCGRCGLWNKYPDSHTEQKWAGSCLWYQIRLADDEVFTERECDRFFEKIPGVSPMEHFDYTLRRDELGRLRAEHRRALWISITALVLSLIGLFLK